jgi:glutaredoxin
MIKKYKLFTTPTCPNCPEVKDYLSNASLEEMHFDVTTDQGLQEAITHNINRAPTVIFMDKHDNHLHTANSLEEVKTILSGCAG